MKKVSFLNLLNDQNDHSESVVIREDYFVNKKVYCVTISCCLSDLHIALIKAK